MFGDKFNFGSLLKNAGKMKEMMEKKQAEMEKIEVHGESGAGAVKVTMTAKHYVKSITLSDEVIRESKEVCEELIAAAVNDAVAKVETVTKSMMMDVTDLLGVSDKDK